MMRATQAKGPFVGVNVIGGGTAAALTAVPTWIKFTITHAQLQAAALTNDIELFSLPAGGNIGGVKIKHSTLFAGVGFTSYKVGVGLVGQPEFYASYFEVLNAVSNTNQQTSNDQDSQNNGAVTSIRVSAKSVGANLSVSSAGVVEIALLLSVITLP